MNLRRKLDLDLYQAHVQAGFKKHDSFEEEVLDWTLGLSGEVGEVAELLKHGIFHKTPLEKMELAKELADIVWYVTAIATTFEIPLEEALKLNVAKLQHRHGGSGYSDKGSEMRHLKEQIFKDTDIYKYLEHEILTWHPEALQEIRDKEQTQQEALKYALKQKDFAGCPAHPTNWQCNDKHIELESGVFVNTQVEIPEGCVLDPVTGELKPKFKGSRGV